jgi:hypothetical protein
LEAGSRAWGGRIKKQIFVGDAAIIWAIWYTHNDIVFEEEQNISFMEAIFREAYWLRFWTLLQREDKRETFRCASKALKVIAIIIHSFPI